MLEDIAILTNVMVISELVGKTLESVTLEDLGDARRVVVDQDATTIIGGEGAADAIHGRLADLKRQIEDTTSATEAELVRKKDAFDDAIAAAKAAIAEGVVSGGGVALIRAIEAVDGAMEGVEGDELIGMRVLRAALAEPCHQIALNAGPDPGVVVRDVAEGAVSATAAAAQEPDPGTGTSAGEVKAE